MLPYDMFDCSNDDHYIEKYRIKKKKKKYIFDRQIKLCIAICK